MCPTGVGAGGERTMMVIMKSGHTREEFDGVMRRLEEVRFSGHPIGGAERTVIGVVGIAYPELGCDLETMPGCDSTVRTTSRSKLCSRESKPADPVIDITGG